MVGGWRLCADTLYLKTSSDLWCGCVTHWRVCCVHGWLVSRGLCLTGNQSSLCPVSRLHWQLQLQLHSYTATATARAGCSTSLITAACSALPCCGLGNRWLLLCPATNRGRLYTFRGKTYLFLFLFWYIYAGYKRTSTFGYDILLISLFCLLTVAPTASALVLTLSRILFCSASSVLRPRPRSPSLAQTCQPWLTMFVSQHNIAASLPWDN